VLEVVPRTWAHLLAEAAGRPIDPRAPIPARWREYASRRTGREAPEVMTEGGEPKFARVCVRVRRAAKPPPSPLSRTPWPASRAREVTARARPGTWLMPASEMGRSADAAARASRGEWQYADRPDGDQRDPQRSEQGRSS